MYMKFNSLKLKNVYMFDDIFLKFENCNMMVGMNGSGKSTMLNIIDAMFCVFIDNYSGPHQNFLKHGFNNKEMESRFELTLEIDDNEYIDYVTVMIILFYFVHNKTKHLDLNETNYNEIRQIIYSSVKHINICFDPIADELKINGLDGHVFLKYPYYDESVQQFEKICVSSKETTHQTLDFVKNLILTKVKNILGIRLCAKINKSSSMHTLYSAFGIGNGDVSHIENHKKIFLGYLSSRYSYMPLNVGVSFEYYKYFCDEYNKIINGGYDEYINYRLSETLSRFNDIHRVKKMLMNSKHTDKYIYKLVKEKYFEITEKKFSIEYSDNSHIDIELYNVVNYRKFMCSTGESQIIKVLFELYSQSFDIIMMDEPSQNLYSIASAKLGNLINDLDKKQIFIVTHDPELINDSNINNLMYFYIKQDESIVKTLNPTDTEKKLIIENKNILFANSIILVEGYHDFRFFNTFIDVIKKNENIIITPLIMQTNGCGSQLYKILEIFGINYGIIFDYDRIYGKKNDNGDDINKYYKCCNFIQEFGLENYVSDAWNHIMKKYESVSVSYNNIMEYIETTFDSDLFLVILKHHKNIDIEKIKNILSDKGKTVFGIKFDKRFEEKYITSLKESNFSSVTLREIYDIICNNMSDIANDITNNIINNINPNYSGESNYDCSFNYAKPEIYIKKFFCNIFKKNDLRFDIKMCDIVDKMNESNKIYIIDQYCKDLEGLCKNNFNFTIKKSKWLKLSVDNIRKYIEDKYDNNKNIALINFLNIFCKKRRDN